MQRLEDHRWDVVCVGIGQYHLLERFLSLRRTSSKRYLRLIDFVYHSTLALRVIKKKKKDLLHTVSRDLSSASSFYYLYRESATFGDLYEFLVGN